MFWLRLAMVALCAGTADARLALAQSDGTEIEIESTAPPETTPATVPDAAPPPPSDSTVAPKPAAPPAAPPRPRTLPGRLGELKLSPEQTTAIIELRKQFRNDPEKKVKDELKAARQSLNQAMADSTPAEEVRRRFDLVQKTYLELQKIKFERGLKIREILNPEQRKMFQELRARPEQ